MDFLEEVMLPLAIVICLICSIYTILQLDRVERLFDRIAADDHTRVNKLVQRVKELECITDNWTPLTLVQLDERLDQMQRLIDEITPHVEDEEPRRYRKTINPDDQWKTYENPKNNTVQPM